MITAALLGLVLGVAVSSPGIPPIELPPGFAIDVFATALGAPRALVLDPEGTLVVSIPSRGQVVALPDRSTGRAVEAVILARGLDLPHGLAFHGGDLYVAETGRILRFRYDARGPSVRDPTVVVAGLPAGAHHWTRSIVFGADGGLYAAIGSSCDVCREADRRRAAIVRYEADGSGERVFASGLRNPVGLAVHPRTGALWTTVNERDWRGGAAPPDYITEVAAGAAYGWPDCYADRGVFARDPEFRGGRDCHGLTLPTLELPPHSAPLGHAFYTGTIFPAPYRDSLFVALHGARAGLPAAGYKVVHVAFRAGRPSAIEDFATGWRRGDRLWGRPVDIVAGRHGELYISDDHGGQVLRITFRPRPSGRRRTAGVTAFPRPGREDDRRSRGRRRETLARAAAAILGQQRPWTGRNARPDQRGTPRLTWRIDRSVIRPYKPC
jgi:glucose/arabinose dehydrogenase